MFGAVNPRGPHHLASWLGSVQALKTSGRGAGRTRVMCRPSSPCSTCGGIAILAARYRPDRIRKAQTEGMHMLRFGPNATGCGAGDLRVVATRIVGFGRTRRCGDVVTHDTTLDSDLVRRQWPDGRGERRDARPRRPCDRGNRDRGESRSGDPYGVSSPRSSEGIEVRDGTIRDFRTAQRLTVQRNRLQDFVLEQTDIDVRCHTHRAAGSPTARSGRMGPASVSRRSTTGAAHRP